MAKKTKAKHAPVEADLPAKRNWGSLLPAEIWKLACRFLRAEDLAELALVNRALNNHATEALRCDIDVDLDAWGDKILECWENLRPEIRGIVKAHRLRLHALQSPENVDRLNRLIRTIANHVRVLDVVDPPLSVLSVVAEQHWPLLRKIDFGDPTFWDAEYTAEQVPMNVIIHNSPNLQELFVGAATIAIIVPQSRRQLSLGQACRVSLLHAAMRCHRPSFPSLSRLLTTLENVTVEVRNADVDYCVYDRIGKITHLEFLKIHGGTYGTSGGGKLDDLRNLTKLQSFDINPATPSRHCTLGVINLFETVGSGLTDLELKNMLLVDADAKGSFISQIGKLCPFVRTLKVNATSVPNALAASEVLVAFDRLRDFSVYGCDWKFDKNTKRLVDAIAERRPVGAKLRYFYFS